MPLALTRRLIGASAALAALAGPALAETPAEITLRV